MHKSLNILNSPVQGVEVVLLFPLITVDCQVAGACSPALQAQRAVLLLLRFQVTRVGAKLSVALDDVPFFTINTHTVCVSNI